MKIMVLTDLEGCCGMNGRGESIGNAIPNQAVAEQGLTNEINACCEGLFAAGADRVVVLDGHGGSSNLSPFDLNPKVELMQVGSWRPAALIDAGFDAHIHLGAHGMQSTGGYMCHSYSSHGIAEMRLNGVEIGEIEFSGLYSAYFHIPTILLSGDNVACAEAKAFFGPELYTVETKFGMNRYAAVNRAPARLYAELREKSAEALKNIDKFPCKAMEDHYQLDVRYMCPNFADHEEMRGFQRLDHVTMRYEADTIPELWAQRVGWAPGVHQRKYNITPDWVYFS